MPILFNQISPPQLGDILLPANPRRAILTLQVIGGTVTLVQIGDGFPSVIMVLLESNSYVLLKFNEIGTALRGPVSVFRTDFGGTIIATDTYRLPDGKT